VIESPSVSASEFVAATHLALLLIDLRSQDVVAASRSARSVIGLDGDVVPRPVDDLMDPLPPELLVLARTAPMRGVVVSKLTERRLEANVGMHGADHIVVHLSTEGSFSRLSDLNTQYIEARAEIERSHSLENALTRRINDLQNMASILSHDLRAPARRVAQWAELAIEAAETGDGDLVDLLARVRRSAESVDTMVRALTNMLVATKALAIEDVSLDDVVAEAREVVWDGAAPVNAVFRVERLPVVSGSRALLVTVFENLISNALKYAQSDRPLEIDVNASFRGGEVTVMFSDNGPGIPKAFREDAFRPFWTQEGSGGDSMGMGLATVRNAMEAIGGAVSIDDSYDQGTRFVLRLRDRKAGQ
jgi:signal transduction histidine kinase